MAESGDAMKAQQPSEAVSSPSKREILQKGWSVLKQRVTKPFKDPLGTGNSYPSQRQLTRREFLKEGAVVAGTVALVGAGLYSVSQSPEAKARDDAYPKPEGMPEDILTKEELQKAGITVYQTKDTQLYLRRGIFDLPLFKDAKEKRIKGVVISLVDSDLLSWNSTSRLPQDARAAWQSIHIHPSEYTENLWQGLIQTHGDIIKSSETRIRYSEIVLEKIRSGEQEKDYRYAIKQFKNSLEYTLKRWEALGGGDIKDPLVEDYRNFLERANRDLEDLLSGKLEAKQKGYITSSQETIFKSNRALEMLHDRPRAIEYFEENGTAVGEYIDTKRVYQRYELNKDSTIKSDSPRGKMAEVFRTHPEWHNTVYIYICVGKAEKPNPRDSYPSPDWFKSSVYPDENKRFYDVYLKDESRSPVGFTIRHEVSHYQPKKDLPSHDEFDTDHLALDSISEAWDKYQKSGDTGGYPFVFVTDQGITITKKLDKQPIVKKAI